MTSLIYHVAPPALAESQQTQPQADAVGNLRVAIAASDGDASVAEISGVATGTAATAGTARATAPGIPSAALGAPHVKMIGPGIRGHIGLRTSGKRKWHGNGS